jgi:uncharacterized Zn finger protein
MLPEPFQFDPFMPQPIKCEKCGSQSVVHAVQYVYTQNLSSKGDTEHILNTIIAVVECPQCGVHTQTTDTRGKD